MRVWGGVGYKKGVGCGGTVAGHWRHWSQLGGSDGGGWRMVTVTAWAWTMHDWEKTFASLPVESLGNYGIIIWIMDSLDSFGAKKKGRIVESG